jgi:peptidoglycan-associated lipoprotein
MLSNSASSGRAWLATTALVATALLAGCAHKPPPLASTPSTPPATPSHRYEPPPAGPMQSSVLPGSTQDFVVNAGDRVYFDFDQFNVRADAIPVLEAQATWLNRYPAVQVRIEGNCDERGTREYNFALGGRRANSVRQFLIEHGVSASRITTVSYGKERPIDPGENDAAWAHDRNAHTDITSGAR